eukprot:31005-Pelagococcus_subviridis.AAC.2
MTSFQLSRSCTPPDGVVASAANASAAVAASYSFLFATSLTTWGKDDGRSGDATMMSARCQRDSDLSSIRIAGAVRGDPFRRPPASPPVTERTLNASTSVWNLTTASSSLTPSTRLSGCSTSASLRYARFRSSSDASRATPRMS